MTRRARVLLQGVGLAGAAAVIGSVAYLLSWRVLWGVPSGSDLPYHLDLVSWVSKSFPSMSWWYRWDATGTSFREGYPLTAHWLTVALSRMLHLGLSDAMQVFEFAITPLCAIGIYAFCAFRLRRPLVGLTAAVLSLLSPIAWTFLFDWGFYANQTGTVLFMPILIALDIFSEEWARGNRGWRYRGSALSVMVLTALLGLVSPAIVAAPLIAIPAYGLAVRQGGLRRALRWVFVATPLLAGGAILLSAFWALPLQGYLASIGARQPAQVYTPSLFHLWSLGQVLEIHPLRPTIIQDRTSLSPAVWIPALVGTIAAVWDGRLRAFLALIGLGFLTMTAQWFYAATFSLPFFPEIVTFRAGMLYLQFLVPVFGALGVIAIPPLLVRMLADRLRVPVRLRLVLSTVLTAAAVAFTALGVATFAERIDGNSHLLAYGAFAADVRDLWQRHRGDVCVLDQATNPLCSSSTLTEAFSVSELIGACRDRFGLRTGIPICAALGEEGSPRWTAADDPLIASILSWCPSHADPVCAARYTPLTGQLLDLRQWRPPTTGCKLDPKGCEERAAQGAQYAAAFPRPPKRAVLDAQASDLLKAFHELTGGGQAGSYASQLVSSPELDGWLQDGMLNQAGTQLKAQLAAVSGADAVVLNGSQVGNGADYQQLGWTQVSAAPLAYASPAPAAIAAEWPSGCRVLVVGATQDSTSHPYNDIFKWASLGMLPVDSGWLVRGRSPYIDDYTADELSRYPVLLLDGYRYHDRTSAWSRLDSYVRNGGRLYVETGWQYVDPDWDARSAAAVLPVAQTQWGALNPAGPVEVQGAEDSAWGSLAYGGSGWGASSASGVRSGAEDLVSVGARAVVARWQYGKGRVVWSGMNLMAHAYSTPSSDEQRFLADQWQWLVPDPAPQSAVTPIWRSDDRVDLSLASANGPVDVLFKESVAPGWSATLRWPGGEKAVSIEPAEMDFMSVHLDTVPVGATLAFSFGPTVGIELSWLLSALALAGLVAWLIKPSVARPLAAAAGASFRAVTSRLRRRLKWDEEN
ncbi:MAG TPA: hypothetical protein VGR77_08680 [Candidatus Dormibacteraeota bacterium]|nr:hypothetical protein [Candidatus Dormibacteraeota bacterium]